MPGAEGRTVDDGGRLTGRGFSVSWDLVEQELLPANPDRVGVIFSFITAIPASMLLNASGAITGEITINCKTIGPIVEFFYSRHGPLPACAWKVLAGASNPTVYVYELLAKR